MGDDNELSEPLIQESLSKGENIIINDSDSKKNAEVSSQTSNEGVDLKVPSSGDRVNSEGNNEVNNDETTDRTTPLNPVSHGRNNTSVLGKIFQSPRSFGDENKEFRRRKVKSLVYTILNPKSQQFPAACFRYFISNVIVVDFIFFVISTEPVLRVNGTTFFEIVEGVSSTIFLVEYLGRIATITESSRYDSLGPFWGRVHFMAKPSMLVDLFATAPFFIEQVTGWNLPTLTFLRTFRLARILKTEGFARAADAVWRVLYYNRQIMYLSLYVGMIMILTTSVLMYYCRPRSEDYKSEEFESILSTMYLATLMLTGQGGPEGELPWYTKAIVLLTSTFSIGMFAIPVSMLTWGFEAEAERCAKRTRQLEKRKAKRAAGADVENYSTDDYSTDEEYKKIIAGEESDEEDSALNLFRQFDIDGSGSLSQKEFIEMMKLRDVANSRSGDGSDSIHARISSLEKKVDDIAEKVNMLCDVLVASRELSGNGTNRKEKL